MNILICGDVVGRSGRRAVCDALPHLRRELDLDFIVVNGENYRGVMPAQRLSDADVANVLTYIYSQWGNNGTVVSPEQVAEQR